MFWVFFFFFFNVLVLLLHGMWDLSSSTKDGTPILFIGRLSLNHRATGTFPVLFLVWCGFFFVCLFLFFFLSLFIHNEDLKQQF